MRLEIETGSIILHPVKKSLWKRIWTYCTTDYGINNPFNRRLGGSQSQSAHFGEEHSLTPPGFKPWIVQPLAQ
jgi:hypothetical protein